MTDYTTVLTLMLSKAHYNDPFAMDTGAKAPHHRISILDQRVSIIVKSIFIGLLTFGIGGIIAFYALTARAKIEKLNDLKLPINDYVLSKTINTPHVTYEFSGGRFGDNLLSYLSAKWVEYQTGFPLLYKPFEFSEQLVLSDQGQSYFSETHYDKEVRYDTTTVNDEMEKMGQETSAMVVVPYFNVVKPNWNDPGFKNIIQESVKLKTDTPRIKLPEDRVSIALHIRKGGGFDSESMISDMPTKFPPHEFYVSGLKELIQSYSGQKFYAYIFTDDPKPADVARDYSGLFRDTDIIFDYNKGENGHDVNVMEDFFNMMQFKCMVRPDSSLSFCASAIGNIEKCYRPNGWNITEKVGEKVIVPGTLDHSSTLKEFVCHSYRIRNP